MAETLCTSGAVKLKAGANRPADDTDLTADNYTTFINEAEAAIAAETRINWVDEYSGLDADFKTILEDAASSHAAIPVINFDMSGYTSRAEAQTMLDVNYARFRDALRLLKEKVTSDFIQGN